MAEVHRFSDALEVKLADMNAMKWDYLEADSASDAPVSDNPSGLYCPACRSVGMSHCSEVEHCGGMRRMKPKEVSNG